jgi:predicted HTH transcriptional regulator
MIPEGIPDCAKVRKELADCLGNPKKVSSNLLTDHDISTLPLGDKEVLVVRVPRANRKQRPVFINGNPLTGTYRRFDEADQAMPVDEVKLLLSEQEQESLDYKVLPRFGMPDLSISSLQVYRQTHANLRPNHPWTELDNLSFLKEARAWNVDRETGEEGLTVAGLLMFGKFQSIQDYLPHYALDYQERPEAKTEKRWIDRIWLDGTWSGNLYDFFRLVYARLIQDLKIPFSLEKGVRKEDTPVHIALREALANTLIHADYRHRARVLIVKRPDMFGFQNPGDMRIPLELALKGEEPDSRNKRLAHLFGFVGIGEKAGTGIPKILDGWKSQHWRRPSLTEEHYPNPRTMLRLQTLDLFPAGILDLLKVQYGSRFDSLDQVSRTALAITLSEGRLTHPRLQELTDCHPSDITKTLRSLIAESFLESDGSGRGTVYRLSGVDVINPEDVFEDLTSSSPNLTPNSPNSDSSSPNLTPNSPNSGSSSPNLTASAPHLESEVLDLEDSPSNRDRLGRLVSDSFGFPFIDSLETLGGSFLTELELKASHPRIMKRVDRSTMIEVILDLCSDQYVRLECLATLVNRQPGTLQGQYLTQLCRERKLLMAFPDSRNHPDQAYTTA